MCVPRSAWQRFKQLPDLIVRGLRFGLACRKQPLQEKQEWALEKPKVDNARQLRGIYFIDPEDEESKETINMQEISWKVPWTLLSFANKETRKRAWKLRETAASENPKPRKKLTHACTVEAHESTRRRLESTLPRNHEDPIAEKGLNAPTHYNLVHKFIPMPQAMKIPETKAAVNEE